MGFDRRDWLDTGIGAVQFGKGITVVLGAVAGGFATVLGAGWVVYGATKEGTDWMGVTSPEEMPAWSTHFRLPFTESHAERMAQGDPVIEGVFGLMELAAYITVAALSAKALIGLRDMGFEKRIEDSIKKKS